MASSMASLALYDRKVLSVEGVLERDKVKAKPLPKLAPFVGVCSVTPCSAKVIEDHVAKWVDPHNVEAQPKTEMEQHAIEAPDKVKKTEAPKKTVGLVSQETEDFAAPKHMSVKIYWEIDSDNEDDDEPIAKIHPFFEDPTQTATSGDQNTSKTESGASQPNSDATASKMDQTGQNGQENESGAAQQVSGAAQQDDNPNAWKNIGQDWNQDANWKAKKVVSAGKPDKEYNADGFYEPSEKASESEANAAGFESGETAAKPEAEKAAAKSDSSENAAKPKSAQNTAWNEHPEDPQEKIKREFAEKRVYKGVPLFEAASPHVAMFSHQRKKSAVKKDAGKEDADEKDTDKKASNKKDGDKKGSDKKDGDKKDKQSSGQLRKEHFVQKTYTNLADGLDPMRPINLDRVPATGTIAFGALDRLADSRNMAKNLPKEKRPKAENMAELTAVDPDVSVSTAQSTKRRKDIFEAAAWHAKPSEVEEKPLQTLNARLELSPQLNEQEEPMHNPFAAIYITLHWPEGTVQKAQRVTVFLDAYNLGGLLSYRKITKDNIDLSHYPGIPAKDLKAMIGNETYEVILPYIARDRIWAENVITPASHGPYTSKINELANRIIGPCMIRFLVQGQLITDYIDDLNKALELVETVKPLQKWFGPTRKAVINPNSILPWANRPHYVMPPKITYRHWLDFLVSLGMSIEQEQEWHLLNTGKTEKIPAWFFEMPGGGDRQYLMLFAQPEKDAYDFEDGETFQTRIIPINRHNFTDEYWTSKIVDMAVTPYQWKTATITRPWDKQNNRFFPGRLPSTPFPAIDSLEDFYAAVCKLERTLIDYSVTPDKHLVKCRRNGLNSLMNLIAEEQKKAPLSSTFEALQACRFDRLPLMDLWETIPGEHRANDLAELKKGLGLDQCGTIDLAGVAPGGICLTSGPPGVGKTYLIARMIAALLKRKNSKTDEENQILVVTPLNGNADDLATKILEVLRKTGTLKDPIVIRKFSQATEEACLMRNAEVNRRPTRTPAIDKGQKDAVLSKMTGSTAKIIQSALDNAEPPVPGIFDKRVTSSELATYSLGQWALVVSGLAEDDEEQGRTYVQAEKFKTFGHMYSEYKSSTEWNTDQTKLFGDLRKELFDCTIMQADVIVCTVTEAATFLLAKNFKPYAIFVDEAAKVSPSDTPALFGHYPHTNHRVFMGDSKQSKPETRTPTSYNGLAPQQTMSDFSRWLLAGFPVNQLTEQHRFPSDINRLISPIFYDDTLKADPEIDHRQAVKDFRGVTKQIFGKRSNLIVIDVPNAAEASVGKSKFNSKTAETIWKFLDLLVDKHHISPADVAILAPYKGQKAVHDRIRLRKQAETMARPAKDDGEKEVRAQAFKLWGRMVIDTVNKIQGRQAQYTFLDLTSSTKPGFLQTDPYRINVALSRSLSGLIIVADMSALMDNLKSSSALHKVLKRTKYLQVVHRWTPELEGKFSFVMPDAFDYELPDATTTSDDLAAIAAPIEPSDETDEAEESKKPDTASLLADMMKTKESDFDEQLAKLSKSKMEA